ncbi:ATP-dependent helicase, partial [candidate division NPL-UPA2 bacterium]|nr:ATP-dependent helicase [candidate division NPL-UPA2 bacterium]
CSLACKYDDLEAFLSDFALDPPSNKYRDQANPLIDKIKGKPLTLSTVHSAKGLEWNSVFIPHLLDGLFPSIRAVGGIEEIEEERRLFYVACTRAEEQLYLTMPSYIPSWDTFFTLPSRFLVEVEREKYELG